MVKMMMKVMLMMVVMRMRVRRYVRTYEDDGDDEDDPDDDDKDDGGDDDDGDDHDYADDEDDGDGGGGVAFVDVFFFKHVQSMEADRFFAGSRQLEAPLHGDLAGSLLATESTHVCSNYVVILFEPPQAPWR